MDRCLVKGTKRPRFVISPGVHMEGLDITTKHLNISIRGRGQNGVPPMQETGALLHHRAL